MNRMDFQALAEARIREAEILLAHGAWDGAYYLAGYAVECALKSCIAKKTREHDFPHKKTSNYYMHDLEPLLVSAELKAILADDMKRDVDLETNRELVKDWDEESRYKRWTEEEARSVVEAVADTKSGVLSWIKCRW